MDDNLTNSIAIILLLGAWVVFFFGPNNLVYLIAAAGLYLAGLSLALAVVITHLKSVLNDFLNVVNTAISEKDHS